MTRGLGREGKEEAIFIISILLQYLGKVLIVSTCEQDTVWAFLDVHTKFVLEFHADNVPSVKHV